MILGHAKSIRVRCSLSNTLVISVHSTSEKERLLNRSRWKVILKFGFNYQKSRIFTFRLHRYSDHGLQDIMKESKADWQDFQNMVF